MTDTRHERMGRLGMYYFAGGLVTTTLAIIGLYTLNGVISPENLGYIGVVGVLGLITAALGATMRAIYNRAEIKKMTGLDKGCDFQMITENGGTRVCGDSPVASRLIDSKNGVVRLSFCREHLRIVDGENND